MNKIKIIASVIAILGSANVMAQNNATKDFKATANIENFCKIEAQDINFGVVNLPLTAQSANAQMKVLCNNSTVYKIDLSYGGKYGAGNTVAKESITYQNYRLMSNSQVIKLYIDGKPLSDAIYDIDCYSGIQGKVNMSSEFAKVYKEAKPANPYFTDPKGICKSSGLVNFNAVQNLSFSSPAYNYGLMTGAFKGDSLAYSIMLPNDSTKVWNIGINSVNEVGSGSEQFFTLNAKIVPELSSSLYVAADNYIDTVTATIAY